ncbi:hypothetical protein [Candidatus Enterococcus clewellii]|uniref:Lipoprotein n=1 Tax=Candidatus Enterococcus clewellii TaxID=1834193 RepID=A0A242JY04_9ENTE|nr:hypothetical protein [Enterococcus sp. 9E7_DIV0242]OTP09811.1 hypothetical protein A5888_004007 [Enterococcus sp. 9E7_DIV0242]
MKKIFLLLLSLSLLSACNTTKESTNSSKDSIESSTKNTSKKSTIKTFTGRVTIGKDGDLPANTYDLVAVGAGYGPVSLYLNGEESSSFRRHMASTEGKETILSSDLESAKPEYYSEKVQGLVLREGSVITIQDVSIEFSKTVQSNDKKILTGDLAVGEGGDLLPRTYNLVPIGDGYGPVSQYTSEDEGSVFRKYIASIEAKKIIQKLESEAGNPSNYSEEILGLILHEGDTLSVRDVSVEFSIVD